MPCMLLIYNKCIGRFFFMQFSALLAKQENIHFAEDLTITYIYVIKVVILGVLIVINIL